MERYLGKYSPFAFALLRIISGLMFACHGGQKVLGMFNAEHQPPFMSFFWIGVVIELVGGFLIAFGLLGGFAAFLCSGEMAVAYFIAHSPKGFFPIVNGGELAVLYCFVFLYIAFHGSGILSIDYLLNRSSSPQTLR